MGDRELIHQLNGVIVPGVLFAGSVILVFILVLAALAGRMYSLAFLPVPGLAAWLSQKRTKAIYKRLEGGEK